MIQKATPRHEAETRGAQGLWAQCRPLIAQLAPSPVLAADFTLIAAMMCMPAQASAMTRDFLHASDFSTKFTQQAARICLSDLTNYGCVDDDQMFRRLRDSRVWSVAPLNHYRETLWGIAEVIVSVDPLLLWGAARELKQ
jgi:hypothetical protein